MKNTIHTLFFNLSLCLLVTTFCSLGYSQIPDTIWARTVGGQYNDMGECLVLTADSCLVVAGHTTSFGNGSGDFYLIKMDSSGDTLWTRVHGTVAQEFCYSVVQTPDQGYMMTGSSDSSLCLMKTDMFGYLEWTKTYAKGLDCFGYGICPTSDNRYIITGHCDGPLGGLWLLKTDSLGDTLWTGTYGYASGDDWGRDIIEVSDGYLIVGTSMYVGADLYLLKTSINGTEQWEKWYGGNMHDIGYAIVPTLDNCFYIAGIYGPVTDEADAWVLKINNSGDTLWTRTYGGYGIDYGIDILSTESDSGFIITGETGLPNAPSDLFVLKCNANGDSIWIRTYGGSLPEGPESMIKMYDGGFGICGYTRSFGAGFYDAWVLRMNGETGIEDAKINPIKNERATPTIWTGPLVISEHSSYEIYDISGQEIHTLDPVPGIYFIKINGNIYHKIVKIR